MRGLVLNGDLNDYQQAKTAAARQQQQPTGARLQQGNATHPKKP